MSTAGLVSALIIGLVCGSLLGVIWDRHARRFDDHRPSYQRKAMTRQQLDRLHIVDDEHTKRWDDQ